MSSTSKSHAYRCSSQTGSRTKSQLSRRDTKLKHRAEKARDPSTSTCAPASPHASSRTRMADVPNFDERNLSESGSSSLDQGHGLPTPPPSTGGPVFPPAKSTTDLFAPKLSSLAAKASSRTATQASIDLINAQLQTFREENFPPALKSALVNLRRAKREACDCSRIFTEVERGTKFHTARLQNAITEIDKRLEFSSYWYQKDRRSREWRVRKKHLEEAIATMKDNLLSHRKRVSAMNMKFMLAMEAFTDELDKLTGHQEPPQPPLVPFEFPFDDALVETSLRACEDQAMKDDQELIDVLQLPYQSVERPMPRSELVCSLLDELNDYIYVRTDCEQELDWHRANQDEATANHGDRIAHENSPHTIVKRMNELRHYIRCYRLKICDIAEKAKQLGLEISDSGDVLHNPYEGEVLMKQVFSEASSGPEKEMTEEEWRQYIEQSKKKVVDWQCPSTFSMQQNFINHRAPDALPSCNSGQNYEEEVTPYESISVRANGAMEAQLDYVFHRKDIDRRQEEGERTRREFSPGHFHRD